MTTLTHADLQSLGYRVVDGKAVKETATAPTDDADVTWQEMQRKCYAVFAKADCTIWWLSQSRRPRVTAGLPDLLIFGPPGAPFMTFWETKAGRGKLSAAQQKFALHCQRTNTQFQCGGEYAARQWLKQLLLPTHRANG